MTSTAMVRYSAGPWLGLVRGRSLVALPPDASEETAAVLWDLLAGGPGVEQLLATILSGRLDLTGMPSFAVVSFPDEDVHAILRGDVHLRTRGHDHTEATVSGTGVSTWNERTVPGVLSFELLVDDAVANVENLPLEAGAVRLAALSADLAPAGDREACPEVQAAARPAPAAPAEPVGPVVPSPPDEPPAPVADDPRDAPSPGSSPQDAEDIGMTIAPEPTDEPAGGAVEDATESAAGEADTLGGEDLAPSSGHTTLVQPADQWADQDAPTVDEVPADEPGGRELSRDLGEAPGPQDPSAAGELIDSVPWLAAARRSGPAPEPAPAPVQAPVQADAPTGTAAPHPDDDADADTVLSPAASAHAAPPSGPRHAVPVDADHDGQTVMRSQVDLGGTPAPAPSAPAGPPVTGPVVLARQCSDGHASPPTATTCPVCGQALSGDARQMRRPALGRIRMSTGEVLDLDRPAVIGRQPQAHRVGSGTMPRMVQVHSPHGDISRSHCEIVLEGWHVQLRDLKATNGTVLIREGTAPRRLGQGETVMVLDGDIADLGDGVSLRFEGIP